MNSTIASPGEAVPGQASIITHPWFPKVVALWFAALFGLCSLALAPDMLEAVVTALGIDRIVPAAAPPLGQTARLLLAMGMAGVGEIVGLLIGARLAADRQPASKSQRGAELGELDELAIDTGLAPQVRARDRHPDAPPRKVFSAIDDLREIDEGSTGEAQAAEWSCEPHPLIEVAPFPENDPPIRRTVAADAETGVTSNAEVERVDALVSDVLPALLAQKPALAVASASLDELGVVQLSERLALALQARRERRTPAFSSVVAPVEAAPMPVAEELEVEVDFDEHSDETADGDNSSLLAMGSGGARAEAVRIEEPKSDTIEPVVIFPGQGARAMGQAPAPFSTPFVQPGFGSVADLELPATAGQIAPAGSKPPADPEETGRALRAALASLQRISGAR